MSLFSELKRRHVFRVAGLYLVVGWVVLQIVDVLTDFMPVPEWTSRLVFVLLTAGFPISLVLAWAIELTPEGIRLESSGDESSSDGGWGDRILAAGVVVILLITGWNVTSDWRNASPEPREIQSLAVLPLDNLMDDPNQAYFVQGMHEALITELSKIEGLKVISRTSTMKYEDSNLSLPEIGAELGVDAIVEGSVLRSGETVRVTAQLIEAPTDRHIWAQNYDRRMTDILSLYADVTREISGEIRSSTGTEPLPVEATKSVDPEAYELYLRGTFLCQKWGPQQMAEGIELMRRAVELDPDHARSHAGLAICLQYSAFFGYIDPLDVMDEANEAADRAVELDRNVADAWVAFAGVRYYMDYDLAASSLALERALAINPNHVRALIHHSWQLGEAGRTAEAVSFGLRAVELDPLTASTRTTVGQAHFLGRDYPAALSEYKSAVELDPADPSLHFYLGWTLEEMGDHEAALAEHEAAVELSGGAPIYLSGLGHALARAGRDGEAEEILAELLRLHDAGAADPFQVAMVQLGLGRHERAIDWLERAYDARTSYLLYINQAPQFDPLRDNERFQELVRRIGW